MTKDEALKMAIKALEHANERSVLFYAYEEAISACKEALKQEASEQEPIAELVHIGNGETFEVVFDMREIVDLPNHTKFYTSPQAREFVGLTDDEVDNIYPCAEGVHDFRDIVRAIEAKLKEKNYG
jgi:hypothetical protein